MKFSSSTVVFEWKPATWLRVTGSDAANFLQGQFTNDLRAGSAGGAREAVYGLWLNVKGKVLADSFVLRGRSVAETGAGGSGGVETKARASAGGGEFWIGSYFSPASVIRERLESFVIADDVVIDDLTAEWAGLTVFGEDASAVAGELAGVAGAATPDGAVAGREGFCFRGRRAAEEAIECVFPAAARASIQAKLTDVARLSADDMARRRLAAGIPAVPVDLGPGELPNEGGLETAAISYSKGCYLGQEVMARLKSMGQVRRRLRRVTQPDGPLPALPSPLFLGGRQVGEWRSAAPNGSGGYIGLALLSLLHVPGAAQLALSVDSPPVVSVIDV